PLPGSHLGGGRDRLRLDPLPARAARRPLVAEPLLAARRAEAPAELLLPPQLARGLHDRPLRGDEPARDRRREHALVDRLPAPRLRLAGDPPRGRRHLPRRAGGRAPAAVRRERRGALQAQVGSEASVAGCRGTLACAGLVLVASMLSVMAQRPPHRLAARLDPPRPM